MGSNLRPINYDELAEQLLAIWDTWKSPELQAKDPNGRMKAITELISTRIGPKEADGYASDLLAEFADYDITYDGASPGEGGNGSAEADRKEHMVKFLRGEFED